MKTIIIIGKLLLFVVASIQLYGQDDPSSSGVIPPSPTAFQFARYGQVPVGTFTGTPNFTIPIYDLRGRDLQHSIYLSYSSNGLRVDEVSSWVGMGWSLIGGGVITRIVRDNPDELSTRIPVDDITGFDPPTWSQIISDSDNSTVDTEPDLYAYNFDGYSGKFVFDVSNQARLIPFDNLTISKVRLEGQDMFLVTTPLGVE